MSLSEETTVVVRSIREIEERAEALRAAPSALLRLRTASEAAALDAKLTMCLAELGALALDAALSGRGALFIGAIMAELGASDENEVVQEEGIGPEAPEQYADPGSAGDACDSDQAAAETETSGWTNDFVAQLPAVVDAEVPAPGRLVARSTAVAEQKKVAVTTDVLNKLQEKLRGGKVARELERATSLQEQTASISVELLRDMIEQLGPTPTHLRGKAPVKRELARLHAVVPAALGRWAAAPSEVNRMLLAWVATRGRAVQDVVSTYGEPGADVLLDRIFPKLAAHSAETWPGAVWGLALGHTSRGANWLADARDCEAEIRASAGLTSAIPARETFNGDDALRRLLELVRNGCESVQFVERVREVLEGGVSPNDKRLVHAALPFAMELDGADLKALRKAVNHEIEVSEAEEEARPPRVAPDWAWYPHTRGKRAVIVGGDPRSERVQRLQQTFGFAELDWVDNASGGVRIADSLTKRMRNGTVDLVIVLRAFSSHKLSDKIFAARDGSCAVVLADTYGVTAVQLAIERFLEASP